MSDKEYEIPVKVVDRRWWANQDANERGTAAQASSLKPTYVEELEQQLADKDKQLQDAIARVSRSGRRVRGIARSGCGARSRRTSSAAGVKSSPISSTSSTISIAPSTPPGRAREATSSTR